MGLLRSSDCVFLLCSFLLFFSAKGSAHGGNGHKGSNFIKKHVYKQYEGEEKFKNENGRYPNEEEITAKVTEFSEGAIEEEYKSREIKSRKHSVLLIKTPSEYHMLMEESGSNHGEKDFESTNIYEVVQFDVIYHSSSTKKEPKLDKVR